MGDASWVLLAAEPVLTLKLKALLLVTGAVTGYAVDALGISPRRRTNALPVPVPISNRVILSTAPTPLTLMAREPTLVHSVGVLPALFWLLVGTGFTVSLPVTFQVLDPATLAAALGGVDLYLALGVAGTLVAAVSFVMGGCRLADDDLSTAYPSSLAQVMRHGAHEIALVTAWVAIAYLAWQCLTTLTGFAAGRFRRVGG